MENIEFKVLNELYKTLTEDAANIDSFEFKLVTKEDSGLETDILTTLHHSFGTMSNTAEGEFYFYKGFFVARMVVTTEVEAASVINLCVNISLINSELPMGCFEYDPEHEALIYSLKIPVVDGLSFEDETDLAGRCVAMAMSVSEQYSAALIECAHTA